MAKSSPGQPKQYNKAMRMLGFGYQYKPKSPKPATPAGASAGDTGWTVASSRSIAPVVLTSGALLFTLGMLIGAVGPWVKVLGLSIAGTDGSSDGWLVVGAGLIALGFLLVYGLYRQTSRWLMLGPAAAGVAGAAVAIHDHNNVSNKLSRGGVIGEIAQVGWGLNLAMVASILLAIISVIALIFI